MPLLTDDALNPGWLDLVMGVGWAGLLLAMAARWAPRLAPPGWARWLPLPLAVHLALGVLLGAPLRRASPQHNDTRELYRSARNLWQHVSAHPDDLGPLLWRRWGTPQDERLIDRTLYTGGARYVGQPYLSLVDNRQAWRLVLLIAALLPLGAMCYYPLALMASAVGALGLWALAAPVLRRVGPPAADWPVGAALLLTPSALLWGSGLLKEPFVLAGMGALATLAAAWADRRPLPISWALLLLAVAVLALRIKPYPMLGWAALLPMWPLIKRARASRPSRWMLALYALVLAAAGVVLFPQAAHEAALSRLQMLGLDRAAGDGRSWVDIGVYDLTLVGLLLKAPEAIATALFRPWLWQVHSLGTALLAAEGLLYALAVLFFLYRIRWRHALTTLRTEPWLGVWLLFALGYAAVLGLSVANLGSLARYRVVCIPLLLGGLAAWGALTRRAGH